MRNFLKLYFFLFFTISLCSFSQIITKEYYFEVKDLNFLPQDIGTNGNVKLYVGNKSLDKLFSMYYVKDFRSAFPGTKRELLLRTYIIDCEVELYEKLKNNYSHLYNLIEIPSAIPLYLPNDVELIDDIGQESALSFINAPSAWDISKGDGVTIGICESINVNQEDLVGKIALVNGVSDTNIGHGTWVATAAGASTDNNIGMASIGFNVNVLGTSGYSYSNLLPLAINGARVINMSWYLSTVPIAQHQELMDELWEDYGVVLVAAAGNGEYSAGPTTTHYPAAYNHVISVTNVGHSFAIGEPTPPWGVEERRWKNIFVNSSPPYDATYGVSVDLSSPGRHIQSAYGNSTSSYGYTGGTSLSAPLVSGTIGLMLSANECLFPDEVESILKLTAFKNDTIPLNLPFQGLIGAGRLDSYKAVDMAKDMADEFGIVEVKNRIIDRWNFILKTSPYTIELDNNLVTNNAILDFSARNSIIIDGGDYNPNNQGFIDLKIDEFYIGCNNTVSASRGAKSLDNNKVFNDVEDIKPLLYPNPNNGIFKIATKNNSFLGTITVFNIFGANVYHNEIKNNEIIDLRFLESGIYFVKLYENNGQLLKVIKFIKE